MHALVKQLTLRIGRKMSGITRTLVRSTYNRFPRRAIIWQFKMPLMLFWGAFSLVPRRQQLRMVVGRCGVGAGRIVIVSRLVVCRYCISC